MEEGRKLSEKQQQERSREPEQAAYYFHQGTNFYSYDYLGVHLTEKEGKYVYVFRAYAPHATRMFVIGDFNGWTEQDEMERSTSGGVYVCTRTLDAPIEGARYKFRIYADGRVLDKADPYARAAELPGKTASVIHTNEAYEWKDEAYMQWRRSGAEPFPYRHKPLNIYEVHLGSFMTRDGRSTEAGDAYLNYRELADELVPYMRQMGYTHIELMPISEYPYDESWGYQVCGYYAPTSRYGTPEDFKYFVDSFHRNGLGVLLDWVPAHFPKDAHGLYEFDGGPLYEYQGKDRQESRSWGTRYFDVGREEVQSFLVSNALFWMREYHIDGLRVDAVASMLYLDYDRVPGEWIPNVYGENKNLEAIAFFRKLNGAVHGEFPDVIMIAEESTAYPMVTKPIEEGGLGFQYKWNMGWANDMYAYLEIDPIYRQYHHDRLTFSLMYAFSEHYILPVSHDEVVHGKKSLLNKCYGSYEEKFASTRTFFAYMMAHPGKKMTFMGCEYGPFREWDYKSSLEWFMCKYPRHEELRRCVAELNRLYLTEPCLYEEDFSWDGFRWIHADRKEDNVAVFARIDLSGKELIGIFHFSPCMRERYEINGLGAGVYRILMDTDAAGYGGGERTHVFHGGLVTDDGVLIMDLPPLTAVYLKKEQTVEEVH